MSFYEIHKNKIEKRASSYYDSDERQPDGHGACACRNGIKI